MSVVLDNSKLIDVSSSTVALAAAYKVGAFDSVCYQLHYVDATPAAVNFVAADVTVVGSTITIAAHGLVTGLKVALTGTNLPGGLSATDYWVIVVNASTIKLADSLVHANAGSAVTISTQGTTADAALTPASLSQVAKLQQSNDGVTYFDVATVTVTITGSSDTLWLVTNPPALYHKVVVTPASGALTLWVLPCSRSLTVTQG
jgi:hypothetical protein